jgi:F-type H+-transporting ATPase subunit delta
MALEGSVARRYARALLEIGLSDGKFETFGQELDKVTQLFVSNQDLRHALVNPVFPVSQRKGVMADLATRLGLSIPVRNFLQLLIERNRIGALADMAREMSRLVDRQAGRVRATLVSAAPLDEGTVAAVLGAIEQRLGKKVILDRKEDPALIGGVVAKVGDVLYDGSVRAQLEQAKERLLAE